MNENKLDLSSLTLYEIEDFMMTIGEQKFRGKQIYEWINKKLETDFERMTNITKVFRKSLSEKSYIPNLEIVEKFVSEDDDSIKYLFKTHDNNIIESVLMKYSFGNSVCLSTQVGCRMGCDFCASTINSLTRNLTAGEILSQIYNIQKDIDISNRISNIVLMGSGEPLDNFDNVIKFIKIINSKEGLCIGERHITLSTCGLKEKIYELADLRLQLTLAISLHAPNDSIRTKIMPIASAISLEDLFKACDYYTEKTKRRITYEYALIKGINDDFECANQLGLLLKGRLAHVNLISINNVQEKNYISPSQKTVEQFSNILKKHGIETTIRRKLGSSINAACGQLRNKQQY